MKSNDLPKGFPVSQADWDKLIAEAPGEDRPVTAGERAAWSNDTVSPGGGIDAFTKRRRGLGNSPRKVPTTIRFDPDVLAALKATGKGWQTRVNAAMREWIKSHP